MILKGLKNFRHSLRGLVSVLGLSVLLCSLPVQATEAEHIPLTDTSMNVESAEWTGWPEAPAINADSAILMDADTGVILYSKNIHKPQYPASTTKILTTLIATERCSLDEMVTFSYKATHDIDPGSNHIGIDANEQLSVEDCLKAILIRSANEVSYGIGEHIAQDTWEHFAPIMNERAKELGALNSNFVNPNGLPHEEHVTTAYDLAMIGRAFFDNELLCKMTLTKQIHLYPTDTQPDEIWENNHMELIPGGKYEYPGLIGCKTGYTNAAKSCLVSCAERDGLKLICVVLRADAPSQYEDTIALLDYGFGNFTKYNVSKNETHYNIDTDNFFYNDNDIFGSSQTLLALNTEDYIILPKTATFTDAVSTISYDTDTETEAARIMYTYHDLYVGSSSIDFALSNQPDYSFEASGSADTATSANGTTSHTDKSSPDADTEKEPSFVFVNLKRILLIVAIVIGVLFLLALIVLFLRNYQINFPGKTRLLRTRSRYRNSQLHPTLSTDLRKKRKQQIADAKRRQRRARRR